MIAERFQADLPATFTFDHPTVEAIAAYLADHVVGAPASIARSHNILQEGEAQLSLPVSTELVAVSGRYPEPLPELSEGYAAVVGSGFPPFWAGMQLSADLQSVLPLNRWDMDACYAPDAGSDGRLIYTRFGAFCHGVDAFDAAAFRLSATEAQAVDPQVRWETCWYSQGIWQPSATSRGIVSTLFCRMLMEETHVAWSAARPALHPPASTLVGVYVGCMYHEYLNIMLGSSTHGKLPPQAFVGNSAPYMVGRISYSFGFSGRAVHCCGAARIRQCSTCWRAHDVFAYLQALLSHHRIGTPRSLQGPASAQTLPAHLH